MYNSLNVEENIKQQEQSEVEQCLYRQLQTMKLEEQTRKMEEKLAELKKFMELQKQKRDEEYFVCYAENQMNQLQGGELPIATIKPLQRKILEEQKEAFKKYGVNTKKITGVKAFKPIGSAFNNEVDAIKPPKEPEFAPQLHSQPLVDIQPQANLADRFGKAKIALPIIEVEQTAASQPSQNHPNVQVDLPSSEITGSEDYEQQQPQQEDDFGEKTQRLEQGATLLEGEYDQQKNRLQFEAAVRAYRGVYKQIEELATQTDSKNDIGKESQTKIICFTCYGQGKKELNHENRNFCSKRCYQNYMDSISVPYQSIQELCPICNKKFIKFDGICSDGKRFCSIACSPESGEMQKLFIQWRLEEKRKQKQEGLFDDSLEME